MVNTMQFNATVWSAIIANLALRRSLVGMEELLYGAFLVLLLSLLLLIIIIITIIIIHLFIYLFIYLFLTSFVLVLTE